MGRRLRRSPDAPTGSSPTREPLKATLPYLAMTSLTRPRSPLARCNSSKRALGLPSSLQRCPCLTGNERRDSPVERRWPPRRRLVRSVVNAGGVHDRYEAAPPTSRAAEDGVDKEGAWTTFVVAVRAAVH
jgi:hypothetical protein